MAQDSGGAMRSAFSARPSSLKEPVPGSDAEAEAAAFLAQYDAPTPAAGSSAEAEAAQFLGEPASAPPTQDNFSVQEPSSVLGVNTDIGQQLSDLNDRIAANIAGDPASVKRTLENRLGPDNVRFKGGKFFIKKTGEKAFRPLDPGTFEIVADIVGDFYKETFQTMGGAAGAAAGAPGGPAGAFVGTGLGVAAATAGVDAYGKSQLGVVKAPESYALDSSREPGLVGQASRAVEDTGEALRVGAEYAMVDGIFKNLGARWAARRERYAGLKKLEEISPTERLQEGVKQNLETLQEMKQLGLTQNITGTNIEVPAHQLYPHLPQAERVAQSVAAEKSFQQAQKEAAENFGQASLDLVEEAARLTPGRLSEVVKTGVPLEKSVSSSDINGLFNQVRRAEGQVIGEFRDLAKDTAKKTPLPAPKTVEAVKDIFSQLGVTRRGEELVFPGDDQLAQVLGTDSKAFIGGLKEDLLKINNKLLKGGLTIDDLIGQSQIIGAKNEGARRIGGPYKAIIGKLSSAIRADSREGVALVLDPADAATYAAKMDRFGKISGAMDQLEGYLRDDIGMNTFAKGLVNKGKEGLANLRAAKEFLLQENPEMYKSLIGQYMEELALKHRVPGEVAGFNPAAMRKELASLGSEYLDELFPKNGPVSKDIVLRSFDLADQVQKSIIKGSDAEVLKDAKKAVGALSWYHRGVNTVWAMMKFGSKDKRLLKMLSREGVESFLAETPKNNREGMRQTLKAILSLSRRNGTLATINAQGDPGAPQ